MSAAAFATKARACYNHHMEQIHSIIDIGSNSVRYMGRSANKRLVTTRLAAGLDANGVLCEDAMERSVAAVAGFAALSREEGLIPAAYATSAVRDAANSAEFIRRIMQKTGVAVDVISGDDEARYALLGAGCADGGLVDIGGGSSQLVTSDWRASFPMGCVRAADICSGAPALQAMRASLEARCNMIYRFPRMLIPRWTGVGGTITTLAALSAGLSEYDGEAVRRVVLTQDSVTALTRSLYEAGDEARARMPLLCDRHDVIIPGALVLLYIMRGMGIYELNISDRDGMEGYLMHVG